MPASSAGEMAGRAAAGLHGNMASLRILAKRLLLGLALIVTTPLILLSRLGQAYGTDALFNIAAQSLALVPGLPGSFLRVAFYKGTLQKIGADVRIAFGSYFSKSSACLGNRISIGAYCILGHVELHDEVLVGSRVSILSGKYEHGSAFAQVRHSATDAHAPIRIGARTWVGEGAIVAAPVGSNCLVSTGAVVTRPVPDGSMAAGNPMKIVRIQPFLSVVPAAGENERTACPPPLRNDHDKKIFSDK